MSNHVLMTVTEAKDLIGCARFKVFEWIDEGKLLAFDIRSGGGRNPHWRIVRTSVLEMQRQCNKGEKPRRHSGETINRQLKPRKLVDS